MVLEPPNCHSSYEQLSRTLTPGLCWCWRSKDRQRGLAWAPVRCISCGPPSSLLLIQRLALIARNLRPNSLVWVNFLGPYTSPLLTFAGKGVDFRGGLKFRTRVYHSVRISSTLYKDRRDQGKRNCLTWLLASSFPWVSFVEI